MTCHYTRYSDSMICDVCRITWDAGDPFPPSCERSQGYTPVALEQLELQLRRFGECYSTRGKVRAMQAFVRAQQAMRLARQHKILSASASAVWIHHAVRVAEAGLAILRKSPPPPVVRHHWLDGTVEYADKETVPRIVNLHAPKWDDTIKSVLVDKATVQRRIREAFATPNAITGHFRHRFNSLD